MWGRWVVALYVAATALVDPAAIFENIKPHYCNYKQQEYSTNLRK